MGGNSDPTRATAFARTGRIQSGRLTASTTAIDLDFGPMADVGHAAIIQRIGMPIATSSPTTRLNTYAPIQKSDDSPRSSASPQVGTLVLHLQPATQGSPHRRSAGSAAAARVRNFVATVDAAAACVRRAPSDSVIDGRSDRLRTALARAQQLLADRDVHGDQREDHQPDRDPRDRGQRRHHSAGRRVTADVGDEREQRDEAGARAERAQPGEPRNFGGITSSWHRK